MKNIWTHKKYPGKKFEMERLNMRSGGIAFLLTCYGPRGGVYSDSYFSWQDAKAAGWVKVK